MSRSGDGNGGSGDGIRVLVLCVDGGIVGIGRTSGRTRVVLVRSTPEVGACRDLSRAEPPDVSVTRLVAGDVRREDREGATNDSEVRTQDADDRVGEVDTLVRWRGVVGARLGFAAFFGTDVVRVREVVTLLAFISPKLLYCASIPIKSAHAPNFREPTRL